MGVKVVVAITFASLTVFVFITFSCLGSLFSGPTPPFESLDPGFDEYDPLNPKVYRSRKPADVAVSATNNIYISLREEPLVQHYSSTGSLIASFDPEGNATVAAKSFCYGLDVSSSGVLYVTFPDVGRPFGRLKYFTENGSLLGVRRVFDPGGNRYCDPSGVAVSSNGSVYVTDSWNGRVQYFTPNGSFLGVWGSRGRGEGELRVTGGIAVSYDGTVYIADSGNDRIQYFTSNGSYLGAWGSTGEGRGEFDEPWDIAVGPGGVVYVCDSGNCRIQYFTRNGSYLGQWGKAGSGNGEFWQLNGVAVAPNGNIYVLGHDRIQYFTPDGSFIGKFPLHRSAYMAIDARRFFSR